MEGLTSREQRLLDAFRRTNEATRKVVEFVLFVKVLPKEQQEKIMKVLDEWALSGEDTEGFLKRLDAIK